MRLPSFLFALLAASPASTYAMTLQLAASPSGPQPVGTPITLTATGTDPNPGDLEYQFNASRNGVQFRLVQDYGISNQLVWVPSSKEGPYTIQVNFRNRQTGESTSTQSTIQITSRLTSNAPVISTTGHPLVALYSAPPCPAGSLMYVRYGTGTSFSRTGNQNCTPSSSMNFYVGGMLPSSIYTMNYVVQSPSGSRSGPLGTFTTGAIDPSLSIPPYNISAPPNSQTSNSQGVLLLDFLSPGFVPVYYFPVAMNLSGQVIWYYPALGTFDEQSSGYIRPLSQTGGHMLVIAEDPNTLITNQILREIDLAGNIVQQTSAAAITAQLNTLGRLGITDMDHDAIRLPNGHTLVIGAQEAVYPAGTQGSTAPVDIVGDAVIDLDQNLQVAWSWSAFDHLDLNRPAVLGETCYNGQGGCPPITLAPIANDWLHANSLNFDPATGDILISLRHQDWVTRISYANGAGDGHVVWNLGQGGSFAINSNDPYPWFSHQHDAEYELGGNTVLSLYDNGNTRVAMNPGVVENSRGYVLTMDQTKMVVTPKLFDLGGYSQAVGSAQRLNNGNYYFESGFLGIPPNIAAQGAEYLPDGTQNFTEQNTGSVTYRAYRMNSLYQLQNTTSPASDIDVPFFSE